VAISKQFIKDSPSSFLRIIEEALSDMQKLYFYNTSTMLFAISSGNLKLANYAYDSISSVIHLISGESNTNSSKPTFIGWQFKALPIKFIACHLEKYIEAQQKQWIATYRQGTVKQFYMTLILREMEKIDNEDIALENKLDKIEQLLTSLLVTGKVTGSGYQAKIALDNALNELKSAKLGLTTPEQEHFYMLYHTVINPLQSYIDQQALQWGATWRTGAMKANKIYQVIESMSTIKDEVNISISDKMQKINQELKSLQLDEVINSSGINAQHAISDALNALACEVVPCNSTQLALGPC
jgi:hypothetical protein